jgi:hypothetical protein
VPRTSGRHTRSFMTQIFHTGQPIAVAYRKIFEVMTNVHQPNRFRHKQIICIKHFVKCCQLAIFTPRRQTFPPCFIDNIISTCKLCSTKTSQPYSNFVLTKVRHIFDRVCLQRVHFSFL